MTEDKRALDSSNSERKSLPHGGVGTETIDLNSLFGKDVTDSGSFEIQVEIWATTFGKVLQALPIPVLLIDQSRNVMAANQACGKIGAGYETMVGKPFSDLFANPSHALQSESLVSSVFSNRKTTLWEAPLEIDKNMIWGRMTFRPLSIRVRRFLLVLVEDLSLEKKQSLLDAKYKEELEKRVQERTEELRRVNEELLWDITERKRSEENLNRAEQFLRIIVDNLPVAVFAKSAADHRFILWNKASETLFGYSEEQVLGKNDYDFFPEEQADFFWAKDSESLTSGSPIVIPEEPILTKNLGPRTLHTRKVPLYDEHRRPSCLLGISEDITDRKKMEHALGESEQLFRSVFENNHVVMLIIDPETGRIEDASPGACSFYGYEREKLKSMKIRDINILSPEEIHERMQIARSQQRRYFDFQHRLASGQIRDVEVCTGPIVVAGKTLLFSVINDVTERKRLEQQLLQSQKMEAIGTLAGGIAHDFNNLLTVVLGYSDLIIADKKEGDRDYEDLRKIIHAARTAGDMVQQILAFSRKTETKPRPINLNKQVEQVRKMLSRLIPKTVVVEMSLDHELPTVNADPAQIDQLLMNLAVNARDAMPDGGRLLIETKKVFLDEQCCLLHVEATEGPHALLTVSDTGVGMDRPTIDRIFEPFYTTKKPGEGTGLGLAMVYGIVKSHGGIITCESEPGKGTAFKICLPAHQVGGEADVTTSAQFCALGAGTILLVDDEDLVRQLGKRILEKAGFTVLTATNGQAAIDIYKKERDHIALVVLDLIMPVMDGNQCLKEILGINPRAKVLIASGYYSDGASRDALESRATGFVGKPYNLRELLKTVRECLAQASTNA